ncbi:MAG: hypothetical protein LBN00_07665 [Oscillospiraceae bacterium]|jgi:hypothetical protein|nr:hypothetical protein [Oscillospiraceae bacterium]
MADYKTLYYGLFNRVSDAIALLQEAQRDAEEQFISADDDNGIHLIPPDGE